MKKHTILFLSLLALLTSCTHYSPSSSSSSEDVSSETPISSSSESSLEPSSEEISSEEEPSSLEPSSEEEPSSLEPRDYVFSFYNINDFHGHVNVEDTGYSSTYCPGASTLGAYLDDFKALNPEGYVFTNSGDMFQETYESYVSKGKVVSEVLDALDCEAMAVGNHEFDWGIDPLMENKQYLGDCDLLGANVYYYDNVNDRLGEPALDKFDPYTIINRQGVNIGVIGVIGEGQWTSISSSVVGDFAFVNPTEDIKKYAYELKEEHDCKIVVVLGHGSFNDFGGNYSTNAAITKEYKDGVKYVDAMFLGHSHKRENKKVNGVPFVQSYSRGSQVSHIELTLDGITGEVRCTNATNIDIDINENKKHAGVDAVLNKYLDENYYKDANRGVGYIVGDTTRISETVAGKFHAYAAYDQIKDLYSDVVLVGNNGGRSEVIINDDNSVSKEMLFRMNPFTNKLCIAYVSGGDILSNFSSYNCYYMPNDIDINRNEMYKVAIVDYLLLHMNTKREYDRFPSLTNVIATYDVYPCDTTINYLLEHGSISLNFLTNDPGFSYLSY